MDTEQQIDINALLESFTLDNILVDKLVNVLNMSAPPDIDQETPFKNIKIVFTRGFTIGVIIGDTYFVRKDFFTGGKRNSAHVDNEIILIKETYKLKKAIPFDNDIEEAKQIKYLDGLVLKSAQETDIDKVEVMLNEASSIATKIKSPEATKMLQEISVNYQNLKKDTDPDDSELIDQATMIIEEMNETGDPEEALSFANQAMQVLGKIKHQSDLAQKLYNQANDIILKSRSSGTGSKKGETTDPPEDETGKKDAEKSEEEFNDLIKRADIAYNKKDWKKAKNLYTQAQKIKPESGKVKEKLSTINQEMKKENIKDDDK